MNDDPSKVTAQEAAAAQKNIGRNTAKGPVVYVGCKLPSGLQIQVGEQSFVLQGTNAAGAVGGYGITAVPKDLWDVWYSEHKQFEPIKRNLIFAQDKEAGANDMAREQSGIKGIEGVNADNPAPGAKKADKEG